MRAILIIGCLLCSGAAAYFGQPLLHDNTEAVLVIITVMTVFAGFLVAIITVLGDPAMIPDGSWRIAEGHREQLETRLSRYLWLFVCYLIAIALLFVGVLLAKAPDATVAPIVNLWIERGYLFSGVASFLFTLGLPHSLWKLQLGRLDAETRRRRKEAGLKD